MNRFVKIAFFLAGSIAILLGVLGIFLPLLPTTPFLLLGAACYLRVSQKLHQQLLDNKWLGSYIKNFSQGKGIPLKAKIITIVVLWITMGYSAFVLIPILYVQMILFILAVGITWYLLSIKTLKHHSLEEES